MTGKSHLNAYRGFAMPVRRGGQSVIHIIDEVGKGVSPKQLGQFAEAIFNIYRLQLRTSSRAAVELVKPAFDTAIRVIFPNHIPTAFGGRIDVPIPAFIPGPSLAQNIHEIVDIGVRIQSDILIGASLKTGLRIARAVMENFGHPSPAVE